MDCTGWIELDNVTSMKEPTPSFTYLFSVTFVKKSTHSYDGTYRLDFPVTFVKNSKDDGNLV